MVGDVHTPSGALSSWQRAVETSSLIWKVNAAVWDPVVAAGPDEIATLTGSGSSTITLTVPVAVGPPGWLSQSKQLTVSGAVLLPAGLLTLVAGIILHASGRTHVRQTQLVPQPQPQED